MVLAINDRCVPDTKKIDVSILLVVTTYDTFTTIFNINNINILIPTILRNTGLSGISDRASSIGSLNFQILFVQGSLFLVVVCHYLM